jgi:hypothetical protein
MVLSYSFQRCECFCKCYSIVQVRVQAIRGLPLFCKDTPEHIAKIVDILVQILAAGKLLLCIVCGILLAVLGSSGAIIFFIF